MRAVAIAVDILLLWLAVGCLVAPFTAMNGRDDAREPW